VYFLFFNVFQAVPLQITQNGVQVALAAAAPIKVTITNMMPKDTIVKLDGKTDFLVTVRSGRTVEKTIPPGTYKFKYAGCLGKTKQGQLKVKQNTSLVYIKPCKMVTWIMTNKDTASTFHSELTGWVTYKLNVYPGQTVTYQLVVDTYKFTNRFCGDTWSGKVKVNKNWRFSFDC
jgi:hypothetical protein